MYEENYFFKKNNVHSSDIYYQININCNNHGTQIILSLTNFTRVLLRTNHNTSTMSMKNDFNRNK